MRYATGAKHIGYWENDLKEGAAKRLYENGDLFEGEFKRDLIHGKDCLLTKVYRKFKVFIKASWEENKVVGQAVVSVKHSLDEELSREEVCNFEGYTLENLINLKFQLQ